MGGNKPGIVITAEIQACFDGEVRWVWRLQRWGLIAAIEIKCQPVLNALVLNCRPKRMKYRVANNLMFMEALAMGGMLYLLLDFEHTSYVTFVPFLSRHFWLFSNTTSLAGPSWLGNMMFYGVMPWWNPHVGRAAVAGFLRDDGTAVCKRRHLSSHGMPLTQATVMGCKFSSQLLRFERGGGRIQGINKMIILTKWL